jgi:hypothetical protein
MMNRREALRGLAWLLGGACSASTLSAVLAGCRPTGTPFVPKTLSAAQFEQVGWLVDLIIPPTDTPGAREAGVPELIDGLLADWATDAEKAQFLAGLADVETRSQQTFGKPFVAGTPEEQTRLLTTLEEEAAAAEPPVPDPDNTFAPAFFTVLKGLTLAGYYTSEVGATQELRWIAAPGRYEGDLPYVEVGRAWA